MDPERQAGYALATGLVEILMATWPISGPLVLMGIVLWVLNWAGGVGHEADSDSGEREESPSWVKRR